MLSLDNFLGLFKFKKWQLTSIEQFLFGAAAWLIGQRARAQTILDYVRLHAPFLLTNDDFAFFSTFVLSTF